MADFVDTFTEASQTNLESHTPDTGTAWTLVVGSAGSALVRTTGAIRGNNTADTLYTISPELSSADQEIEVRYALNANFPNCYACIRLVDENNFVGFRIQGSGSTGRRLSKCVAGVVTDLITGQGVDNEWAKLKGVGSTIQIFEGGTGGSPGTYNQIGTDQTVTDHQTELSCGLRPSESSANNWLHEFRATSLGATGQPARRRQASIPLGVEGIEIW